jgi:hypothetical protein
MLKSLAVVAFCPCSPSAAAGPAAGTVPAAADELTAAKVAKLPAIDGKADDDAWKTAKEVVVKIDQPDEEAPKKTISIKAVHDGDSICFLLVWADADKNDQHSPFIWKDTGLRGRRREGRGRLHARLRARGQVRQRHEGGIESKWDVWEWGAARTNPQRLRAGPDARLFEDRAARAHQGPPA